MVIKLANFFDATFQPTEMEAITGMKPALIRDWRRRGLLHARFDRQEAGFSTYSVAALLLLARLSDHGIGPKAMHGWIFSFADKVRVHALNAPSAWTSSEAWDAWREKQPTASRFLVIPQAPQAFYASDDLSDVTNDAASIATIANLKALGDHLRTSAGRPLAGVEWSVGSSAL